MQGRPQMGRDWRWAGGWRRLMGGQFSFPVRFKGSLNISVVDAGLQLMLCRFCAVSLSAGQFLLAAPAGALSVSGAGADGLGLVVADGEGFFYRWIGGVAEKEGVSLPRGIGLIYTHPLSPFREPAWQCLGQCWCALWGGGGKRGRGILCRTLRK